MKKLLLLMLIFTFTLSVNYAQKKEKKNPNVNYAIDNMGYWQRMAKLGYVSVAPKIEIPKAIFKGSKISLKSIKTTDSPDILITGEIEQTETSVFVNPSDNNHVLNSNNSGNSSNFYGTSSLITTDGSQNPWGGTVQSTGGSNNGDPAAVIGLNGRLYNGFIHSNSGQGVAYSDDGITWTSVVAGNAGSGGMLDKNHLWIDNVTTSPYEGNVYDAWTDFGGGGGSGFDNNIGFVHSADGGLTYSTPINLSSAVNAGSHNQGVNLNVGKNGEVYATWAIYDDWGGKGYEEAIGFSISTDGGETFAPATRILSNIKGIRDAGVSKNMRVNSFPVMSVDVQTGDIYVVWTNIGFPGINTGTNKSVYMIKSSDDGDTWSEPIRVNQGENINGKEAYEPWITCDPETGTISVIYYDDRDVSSTQVETWVSNSFDGGDTWEAFRVSDVAFTPSPLPGMATGYMGDYLGISARGGKVYPVWPDNRSGSLYTYCSVYETNNRARPTDLNIALTDATGQTDLTWSFTDAKTLQHFIIYRDGIEMGTSTTTSFTDLLPVHGTYSYSVTAMHNNGESSASVKSVTWGNPNVVVSPTSLSESLLTNQSSTKFITVSNTGELDLTYDIITEITSKGNNPKAYCSASGGSNDEFISNMQFAGIDNSSGYTPYSDYTAMVATVDAGNSYDITIVNGTTYASDDLGVWIDWNQDEDFDDAGENVVCESSNSGQGTYSVAVPSDALGGQTRMRIRIKYSGSDCGSPCGTTTYGEVEDYTVNVNSWLKTENTIGTILPGRTEMIPVTFISTDLAEGTYNANIKISSNDSDEALITVPVTLNVVGTIALATNPFVDDIIICSGSTTTLHANTTGGSGTYTYSWTSTPAGFTSTDENPEVIITENIVYHLTANDGIDDVTGNVSVNIFADLSQADAPTGTETEFCQDGANTLYQTTEVSGADSYNWILNPANAGTVSGEGVLANIDWDSNFSGEVSISVAAVNSCETAIASNPLSIIVNALPNVNLSNFEDICIDENIFTLTGGSPEGGTYFGEGVTAGNYNPTDAGVGNHTITYTYSNGTCENSAQSTITVNELPTVTLVAFNDVAVNDAAFTLTGGNPAGGTYSGDGIEGDMFYPSVAGEGTHTITYTYSDENFCENSAQQTIFVDEAIGIKNIIGNVKLLIYPNPATETLHLDVNSFEKQILNVKIINQIGITILDKNISVHNYSKSEFDISNFSAGIYFITINSEKINITRKIIIE